MQLRVTQYGEPILTKRGARIDEFSPQLRRFAEDMIETMYGAEGIGLAAQQVGKALQLCVVDVQLPPEETQFHYLLDGKRPPMELIMPMVLANPEVAVAGAESGAYEEGCLSFPDIRGDVVRPLAIRVGYQDLDGVRHDLECDGILARVIQHEVDHLHGILFTERMSPAVRKRIDPDVKRLRKRTRDAMKKART